MVTYTTTTTPVETRVVMQPSTNATSAASLTLTYDNRENWVETGKRFKNDFDVSISMNTFKQV